jgi:Lamin Tail Domain
MLIESTKTAIKITLRILFLVIFLVTILLPIISSKAQNSENLILTEVNIGRKESFGGNCKVFNSKDNCNVSKWVELYNPSDVAIDLAEYKLNDSNKNDHSFSKTNAVIAPKKWFVVSYNQDSQAPFDNSDGNFYFLNDNFELKKNGVVVDSFSSPNNSKFPTFSSYQKCLNSNGWTQTNNSSYNSKFGVNWRGTPGRDCDPSATSIAPIIIPKIEPKTEAANQIILEPKTVVAIENVGEEVKVESKNKVEIPESTNIQSSAPIMDSNPSIVVENITKPVENKSQEVPITDLQNKESQTTTNPNPEVPVNITEKTRSESKIDSKTQFETEPKTANSIELKQNELQSKNYTNTEIPTQNNPTTITILNHSKNLENQNINAVTEAIQTKENSERKLPIVTIQERITTSTDSHDSQLSFWQNWVNQLAPSNYNYSDVETINYNSDSAETNQSQISEISNVTKSKKSNQNYNSATGLENSILSNYHYKVITNIISVLALIIGFLLVQNNFKTISKIFGNVDNSVIKTLN